MSFFLTVNYFGNFSSELSSFSGYFRCDYGWPEALGVHTVRTMQELACAPV